MGTLMSKNNITFKVLTSNFKGSFVFTILAAVFIAVYMVKIL